MSVSDAMFLELLREPVLGMKRTRPESCTRCERETSHEFVCLQESGPRVWGYSCLECRRKREEMRRSP